MLVRIEIYESKLANDLISLFFLLFVLLLPFDSIRFINTSYCPLSLIPFVLLLVVCLPKIFSDGFTPALKYYSLFYLCSSLISLIQAYVNNNLSLFFDYFVTLSIGFFLFATLNVVLSNGFDNDNEFMFKLCKLIAIAYFCPVFIALIDLFAVNSIFIPYGVSTFIHGVFGGGQPVRVCGTTSETSWLCMHLFFAFFAYFYLFRHDYRRKFNAFMMFLMAFVLLFSFSTLGYAVLAFFLLYLLLVSLKKNGLKFYNFGIPLALVAAFLILKNVVIPRMDQSLYFVQRFFHLSIPYLIHNDASVFVRLINPTIALIMGAQNLLFGVGGGQYSFFYGSYVKKYFPFGLEFYGGDNEIVTTIAEGSANSKCLYARLFSENGLFSLLYFAMIHQVFKNVRNNSFLKYWLVVMLLIMFQFDSLCYFPFIFVLSVCNSYKEDDFDDYCRYLSELQWLE